MDPNTVVGTLWAVWLFSWFVAAAWTGRTRVRQSIADRLMHTLLISVGVMFLFGLSNGPWSLVRSLYPRVPLVAWCGVAGVVMGLAWTWWARLHLGRLWSARVGLKEDHAIVRTGPYRLTRHPIYSGVLLALLASAAEMGTLAAFCGFALCAAGFVIKSRQEERLLESAFRAEYAAYRSEVPALIPRLW